MKNEHIEKSHLILCEGRDEQVFLNNLMRYYESKKDYEILDSIQVMNFGGNEQFKSQLPVIMMTSGFSDVRSLIVIRDAEKNGQNAFRSVTSILKNNGLPIPDHVFELSNSAENPYNEDVDIQTGIILFPCTEKDVNGTYIPDDGTLEDLCFSIIRSSVNDPSDLKERSVNFVDTVNNARKTPLKRIHKNRIHVFLASTDECVDAKVGEAVDRGVYNLEAPVIHRLVDFLKLSAMA